MTDSENPHPALSLHIFSGGSGSMGEQVTRTVVAQFDQANVTIRVHSKMLGKKQLKAALTEALEENALLVHLSLIHI